MTTPQAAKNWPVQQMPAKSRFEEVMDKWSEELRGPDRVRPIPKRKRWKSRDYLDWVATLPCVNCGLHDETIVAHHLKHRHAPHGGGAGMKANDYLTMPLCFGCHQSAHSGDRDVLDWQADFIFRTLDKAFSCGKLTYQHATRMLFGEELYD